MDAEGPRGVDPAEARAQTPADERELAALVGAASASGQPIFVEGSGTKRHHGPRAADMARGAASAGASAPEPASVSLRRLDRVTFYEPGDMVIGAQAGARLADVQRVLAEHGQRLPFDPPYAEATIGGILATGSGGPRRLAHGMPRDHLLGLRVVNASGEITKSGGRVVKNVTGYDLHRLHVGAFGTLGVLLEAFFKVTPLPEVSGAMVLACPSFEVAHRLLLQVWSSPLRPAALEARDRGAARALRELAPFLPEGDALVIVGIEGTRPVFDRHARALTDVAGAMAATIVEGADGERLWTAFRDERARRLDVRGDGSPDLALEVDPRGGEVVVRVGARPHDLAELLQRFELHAAGATGVSVQAGTGLARIQVPAREDTTAALAQRVSAWHALAQRRAGYAVVEAAPIALSGRAALPFSHGSTALAKAIKARWDPRDVLNPGRMVL